MFRSAESGELKIPENALVFALPNVRHYYWYDEKTGWDDEWLEVEASAILPVLDALGLSPERPVVRIGGSPRLTQAFRRIFDLARHGASELRLAAGAYEVFATAFDEIASVDVKTHSANPVDVMMTSFCQDDASRTSVRDLTSRTGLSVSRMRALFRAKTGLSPKQYQLKVRLGRAAKMLSDGKTPIVDIAVQVGFKTAAAFSTAFTKLYGLSPARYRNGRMVSGDI